MNHWNSHFKVKDSHARLRRTRALVAKQKSLRAKPESSAEKRFKREVRERDDYTCQRCLKVRETSIHVHHIAPRSRRPDLKLDVDNGICLCAICHAEVHRFPIEATEQGFLSTASYELAQKI